MRFVRLICLAALAASVAVAAGSVTVTCALLGTGPIYTATFAWTGDSSTGSVPSTSGTCIGQVPLLGYYVTQVEVVPGSPSPTAGD